MKISDPYSSCVFLLSCVTDPRADYTLALVYNMWLALRLNKNTLKKDVSTLKEGFCSLPCGFN